MSGFGTALISKKTRTEVRDEKAFILLLELFVDNASQSLLQILSIGGQVLIVIT